MESRAEGRRHERHYIRHAPEALLPATVALAVGLGQWAARGRTPAAVACLALGLALAGVAAMFYRGAAPSPWWALAEPSTVLCPCDGRVMQVAEHASGPRRWTHIAIFLNVHNVHVQYAPLAGVVRAVRRKAGQFAPAYLLQKSAFNERVETELQARSGGRAVSVYIVQIAGQVARRIVHFCPVGTVLRRGDPLGLIKLGSRVDVWLPCARAGALVQAGQRVRPGDPLARLPP